MTTEEITQSLTCRPLWEHLENTREGHWCEVVTRLVIGGCDNQTVFSAMGLGQHSPIESERARLKERTAYFNAFNYLRALNWMIVKQPVTIGIVNGQPLLQMR